MFLTRPPATEAAALAARVGRSIATSVASADR